MGANAWAIVTPSEDGKYHVSVIELGANGASEADADFGIGRFPFGRVKVGISAAGNIGSVGDEDGFDLDLEAGKTYQIDMEGSGTNRGTLLDPNLFLFDGLSFVTVGANNDGGDNLNSRLTYTPPTTGDYFIQASAATESSGTSTYTLSVRDVTPPAHVEGDTDLAGDASTPGVVEVDGYVARGAISEPVGEEYDAGDNQTRNS